MRLRAEAIALALLVGACSGGGRIATASAAPTVGGFDRVGVATWYGEELKGARTASGARFDPSALTAAHRTLPLNSYVEVTALDTGRTLLVLINDRGPGRRDREIDLSRRAAQMLGIDRNPKAQVRIRAVAPSDRQIAALRKSHSAAPALASPEMLAALRRFKPAGTGAVSAAAPFQPVLREDRRYLVRVATFSTKTRARALADLLDGDAVAEDGLWRVQLGPFRGARKAQQARDAAVARGYGDARIQLSD